MRESQHDRAGGVLLGEVRAVSAPQFTSGPWMAAASPSSVVGWPIVREGVGRSVCSVSYLPRDADAEVYAESEANAHLIAAAPELYEALSEADGAWADAVILMVHADQRKQQRAKNALYAWRDKANAALAKARGESA